jgi:hypothetical protein
LRNQVFSISLVSGYFVFLIFMSDFTTEGAEGAEEEGREMNNFKVYL